MAGFGVTPEVEGLGHFFPGKLAGPVRQKLHVHPGQLMLAAGPGDFLDKDPTKRAVDVAHPVQEEDQESPQRNELKPPLLEMVIAGTRLMAARADGRRTTSGAYPHLNAVLVRGEFRPLVDEPWEAMTLV